MGRYRHQVYETAKTPRFCVLFNLQWKVIESVKLAPAADLPAAMGAAIDRQTREGWQTESGHEFGFVFLRRGGERRLLILTERATCGASQVASRCRMVFSLTWSSGMGAITLSCTRRR